MLLHRNLLLVSFVLLLLSSILTFINFSSLDNNMVISTVIFMLLFLVQLQLYVKKEDNNDHRQYDINMVKKEVYAIGPMLNSINEGLKDTNKDIEQLKKELMLLKTISNNREVF